MGWRLRVPSIIQREAFLLGSNQRAITREGTRDAEEFADGEGRREEGKTSSRMLIKLHEPALRG